ncbi:MAG: shikimate dehydrogenase [Acidiferrobacteraceae bacterium]
MSRDPFAFEKPRRYAVMGYPVSHSLSPLIHAEFARAAGLVITYEAIEVSPGGFPQAVSHFQALGGAGLNITVPFKLEAARFAHRLTPAAAAAGAANVLVLDTEIVGDNTDGAGLLRDLNDNLKIPLAGRDVLVIGAGGAARGVLGPLSGAGVKRIVLASRDPGRARSLLAVLGAGLAAPTEAIALHALHGQRFDLVINATSAGLSGVRPEVPDEVIDSGSIAYDLMYGDGARPFTVWARSRGARATDGLGMLVEQAALSFGLWHGVHPQTAGVLAMLRRQAH